MEQKNVTKKGTVKSTINPWKIETMAKSFPIFRVMIGRVVSIEVAPPDEIGARLPNQRTMSGVKSSVLISRNILDNNAMVPNSAPLHLVMNILDSE